MVKELAASYGFLIGFIIGIPIVLLILDNSRRWQK
jgi:hypothetical protein